MRGVLGRKEMCDDIVQWMGWVYRLSGGWDIRIYELDWKESMIRWDDHYLGLRMEMKIFKHILLSCPISMISGGSLRGVLRYCYYHHQHCLDLGQSLSGVSELVLAISPQLHAFCSIPYFSNSKLNYYYITSITYSVRPIQSPNANQSLDRSSEPRIYFQLSYPSKSWY